MHNLVRKLKLVFIPYFVLFSIVVFGFGLFKWLFEIKLHWLYVEDDKLEFIFPAAIAALLIFFFLRKRIHVLKVGGSNEKGFAGYQFAAWITIVFACGFFQKLIGDFSYDLTTVYSLNEINTSKPSKFYKIHSARVSKQYLPPYVDRYTTGKHGNTLNFDIYFATPLFSDGYSRSGVFWKCVRYHTSTNARGDIYHIDALYNSFIESSRKSFEHERWVAPQYYENIPNSNERYGFYSSIRHFSHVDYRKLFILQPVFTSFESRYDDDLRAFVLSCAIGPLIFLIMAAVPKIDEDRYVAFKRGTLMNDDEIFLLFSYLIPKTPHVETSVLLNIMIVVYAGLLLMDLSIHDMGMHELNQAGAMTYSHLLNGDFWMLLTSPFIHSGFWHLLVSIGGIGLCGYLLEPILKPLWFTAIFMITGICSGLFGLICAPDMPFAGALGCFWGYAGVIFVFIIKGLIPLEQKIGYHIALIVFAGASLMIGFLVDGANNFTHIGGLVSGIVLGLILSRKYPTRGLIH